MSLALSLYLQMHKLCAEHAGLIRSMHPAQFLPKPIQSPRLAITFAAFAKTLLSQFALMDIHSSDRPCICMIASQCGEFCILHKSLLAALIAKLLMLPRKKKISCFARVHSRSTQIISQAFINAKMPKQTSTSIPAKMLFLHSARQLLRKFSFTLLSCHTGKEMSVFCWPQAASMISFLTSYSKSISKCNSS